MEYMERMRPKGYNKKAWAYFYKQAEADKLWAINTLKADPNWINEASVSSYLYLKAHELAKQSYDYSHMRAHGQTYLGSLDDSARELWEAITGKRILLKNTWKYDHTVSITSAQYVNKKWISSFNKECNYKGA